MPQNHGVAEGRLSPLYMDAVARAPIDALRPKRLRRRRPLRFRQALPGVAFGDIFGERPLGGRIRAVRRIASVLLWTLVAIPIQAVLHAPIRAPSAIVVPSMWQNPWTSTRLPIFTPGPKMTWGSIVTSVPMTVSAEKCTVSGATSVTPSSMKRRR